jgi:hypothetical protein
MTRRDVFSFRNGNSVEVYYKWDVAHHQTEGLVLAGTPLGTWRRLTC